MSQHSAAIHYTLDVSSLAGHILGVVLHIDLPSSEGHVLSLPAWIPGSYMIRDFAKNIVQIHAEDEQGVQLTLRKNDKQTWQLPPTSGPIKVHYRIFQRHQYFFSGRGTSQPALRDNADEAQTSTVLKLACSHHITRGE